MNISAQFIINRGSFCLDINLNINTEGIISIYGASGSGKTTFLRALAGLEVSDNGYIRLETRYGRIKTIIYQHIKGPLVLLAKRAICSHT